MIGVAIMPLYIIISTWKSYYATSYFATNDTKTPPDTYLLVRGIIIDNVYKTDACLWEQNYVPHNFLINNNFKFLENYCVSGIKLHFILLVK